MMTLSNPSFSRGAAALFLVLGMTGCQSFRTGSADAMLVMESGAGGGSPQIASTHGRNVEVEQAIRQEWKRRRWVGKYSVEKVKLDQLGGWSAMVRFIPEGPGAFAFVYGHGTKITRWEGGE